MIIINFFITILYYAVLLAFMCIYTPISVVVWLITTPFDKKRFITHKSNCDIGLAIIFLNPFWRSTVHGFKNVDKKETYVITPNHQSLTDICLLMSTRLNLKWVSKKELTYVPFIGWVMAMANYVLLDRKDPKSQFKMMRKCENYLKDDVSIAIFPEGTRSRTGELNKFRDGAALLARKTGRRILPVCNYGNNKSMPQKGFIWTKRNKMNMYFLDPIDPKDFKKTKDVSIAVQAAIQKKMDELKAAEKSMNK